MRSFRNTTKLALYAVAVAICLSANAYAQSITPEEKQKKIAYGEQFDNAWDLYQDLVKKANGGRPLTPATMPDWTGVYKRAKGGNYFDLDQKRGELPTAKLTPEAHAEMMDRIEKTKAGIQFDPISTCLSPGVPRWLDMPFFRDFYVTPKTTIMIAEAYNSVRRIYTDGRGHLPEEERFPSHNGDSIGIWDGDSLIFHTRDLMAHYYERTQPRYSEQTETVEVWRKISDELIEADVWVFDPVNLTEPWYTRQAYKLVDDPDHVFRVNHWECKGNQNNDVYLDSDGNSNFVDFDFTTTDDKKGEEK